MRSFSPLIALALGAINCTIGHPKRQVPSTEQVRCSVRRVNLPLDDSSCHFLHLPMSY